jgi:hypothetical protein
MGAWNTVRSPAQVAALELGIGLLALWLGPGCGTALYQTKVPFSEQLLPQLRQAGAALGCQERSSQLFDLFLICPGSKQALGIAHAEGELLISCPDLGRQRCRRFFARVQRAAPGARER